MAMDNKKLLFLSFVVETITENPEWLPDLTLALNQGLSEALSKERQTVSDLAWGFGWMVKQNPENAIKFVFQIEKGLHRLHDFFVGTHFQKVADNILEHYKEE